MYLQEHTTNISFITITNSDGAFIDILDEFPNDLEDTLSQVTLEVTDIFPTSIAITLEGDKYDIIEAMGQITQLLIINNIFNFHFTFHTVEQYKDA